MAPFLRSFLAAALGLGALAFTTQCNSSSSCSISASSYDRSCQQDSDCFPVFSGSVCGSATATLCACENAAISVKARVQYENDLDAVNPPRCPCPSSPPVGCKAGTCGLETSSTVGDAGSD